MTSRPLGNSSEPGGPVATHVHSGGTGREPDSTQVTPPSSLRSKNASVVLTQKGNSTEPLLNSTGAGLRTVVRGVSAVVSLNTTDSGPQLTPPSLDRFTTRSIHPVSPQFCFRPSANNSREVELSANKEGIRKHQ